MASSVSESKVCPEVSEEKLWDRRHAARRAEAEAKKQARIRAKRDFENQVEAFWAERTARRDAAIRKLFPERAMEIVVEALGLHHPRAAAVTGPDISSNRQSRKLPPMCLSDPS